MVAQDRITSVRASVDDMATAIFGGCDHDDLETRRVISSSDAYAPGDRAERRKMVLVFHHVAHGTGGDLSLRAHHHPGCM